MTTTRTLHLGIRAIQAGQAGSTLILVPGWPQTAEAFLPLIPSLSAKHRVYILDPPGLGHSDAPASGDYSTGNISRILHEAVSATTDEPIHIISHDIGVWIAYAWVSQYPDRIRSVTFMDASVPGMFPPLSYPLPEAANKKLFQFSFNALPDLPEILVEGREGKMLDWLFDTKTAHPERIPRSSRDIYTSAYSQPGAMTRGFEYYRAVANSGVQNAEFGKAKLQMPVLALGGSGGLGAGMSVMAGKVAANSHSHVLEDCGHYLMEEQPEAVSKLIVDFLERVESS